jgi:hypothetical protein
MTISFSILAMIALFVVAFLASSEVVPSSRLRLEAVLHGFSVLLIVLAISTRGVWFDAETYLGDFWTAQEALHKTAQGLRSSLDYFSPIGPFVEWVYALTLLLQTPSASSLVLGNVCIAILSLVLTVVLLRRRASSLTVAISGLIAVTTALTPRDIDSLIAATQSSMLAPYNRWGWALLVPVAMRTALPIGRSDMIGDLFTGIAIALLLLLKVTYGLAAIGILLVALALQPSAWRGLAMVLISILLCMRFIDLGTGGQVRAYFADLSLVAQIPSNGINFGKFLASIPTFIAFICGSLLMVLAATCKDPESASLSFASSLTANWKAVVLAIAAGGSGLAVLMQNHYSTEPTTLLLMFLIVGEWTGLTRIVPTRTIIERNRTIASIGALLLVTLSIPLVDSGFILAQKVQTMRKRPLEQYNGTESRDLFIDEAYLPDVYGKCGSPTCRDYSRMISGRALLKNRCPKAVKSVILALNFSNPFPSLLGSPSPRRSAIWLHNDRSFSSAVHMQGTKLFADVDCVMVAKNEPNAAALTQVYDRDLHRVFVLSDQNDEWQLWTRK